MKSHKLKKGKTMAKKAKKIYIGFDGCKIHVEVVKEMTPDKFCDWQIDKGWGEHEYTVLSQEQAMDLMQRLHGILMYATNI